MIQVGEIPELDPSKIYTLDLIWEANVPSKIKVFAWIIMLDRLPTRVQLIKRAIIPNSANNKCTFCSVEDRSLIHLFFFYHFYDFFW